MAKSNNRDPFSQNDNSIRYISLLVIIMVAAGLFLMVFNKQKEIPISYTKLLNYVENDSVTHILMEGRVVRGKFKTNVEGALYFRSYLPIYEDKDFLPLLKQHGVEISVDKERDNFIVNYIISTLILVVIFAVFWFFISKGAQSGDAGKAFSFAKTRARLYKDVNNKVKFSDVAGCEEAKEDLKEIVEFLKNPQKFSSIGARIPKGVLLVGSPGTGKTLLAKAVAGEAGVPFFSVSGSEFVEMFVGVGAARVRDLFSEGRKNAPCIIFIDELDAVGRSRGTGLGGSHDEREQTLNQILVEMDGFDSSEALIIIAATNRPDVLDPALLRPGRFDRQVVVDKPDVRAREEILKIHVRKIPLAKDVNLEVIARGTPGFTGADIENLVNEAALHAARLNKKEVGMDDFEFAKDKVMMGAERRNAVLSEEEKLITAYHEAGHAIVGHLLPLVDPIHKVTIIPRGRALGVTATLPLDERKNYSKEALMQELVVLLAGRAAEEIKFGKEWISTGASNDIERTTRIANSMVCEWGMSEKLGPVTYGEKEGPVFLGKDLIAKKNFSEKIHELIDNEVKNIVSKAYEEAKSLIEKNIKKLDKLANALLEKEVLNAEEIEKIIGKTEKKRYPILENIGYRKRNKKSKK